MSTPLVTVIIATFNWSTVLPFSIRSVLAQSLADFELLVIGDGCTDDSANVVAGITDARLRWINLERNTGHQSGPNNRGLREAKGEFIAYLGHDDLWLPHHLDCMVAALKSSAAALAYSIVGQVSPGARIATPVLPTPEAGSWTSPAGIVHRRGMTVAVGGWKDYRELDDMSPDSELWARAHAAGFAFEFVPRLTAIKFPAAWRRNVYREKPFHEQATWLERIEAEPDFESSQLVSMIESGTAASALPGRVLFPLALRELGHRVRLRSSRPFSKRKRSVEFAKAYKGVQE